ncbi:MAG: GIY-YIG nuclease family protein, partial [Nitrososphaerales archaeon]
YTGYTVDPEQRLRLHNLGRASKFTRARLPVEMVHLERFRSKSRALKREIGIKRMSRKKKIELFA